VELCEADCAFAAEAFNLDWPRLVARMRALEAVERTAGELVEWAIDSRLVEDGEKVALTELTAALEAAKEAG
jgi:hypothetical protein